MIHSGRARRALAHLAEIDPALAALALWCRHRDDAGATRTDGETIRYGAGFDLLPLAEQVGLAAHHVLHVALRHGPRQAALAERLGPGFDPYLYALAADGIVNEALGLAGHALPRPHPVLSELLAEIGEPAETPEAALADWDAERLALRLQRDEASARRARAHGRARAFVPDLAPEPAGAAESAEIWAGHMERARSVARAAGTGIGPLLGRLAETGPARIPWEHHLRRLLARALIEAPRPSWRRPAGRWTARHAGARARGAPAPPFEPGRQRLAHLPRIVAAVDTSSSVGAPMLALFAAEIGAIAARTAAETWLLGFDAGVHLERRLAPGAGPALGEIALRRGGGTDFAPVMESCRRLAPSLAVVLTDLVGPHGPAPSCPVIWVAPEDAPAPPFGRHLPLPV